MSLLLSTFYLLLIVACFVYLVELVRNSKVTWQVLELQERSTPSVSIVVPTLNEERNIENCLESLSELDYPLFEIIVVDGGSEDRTVELAKKWTDKVIVDSFLPRGWIGKCYGCFLGYKMALGDLLLFTDADTIHSPNSLKIMVGQLLGTDSVMLSLLPFQKAKRWYENLISFFFFLSFLAGGPINGINNPYKKDSFMAIGQYLLFTRRGYEEIGGHLAVSNSIAEDVAFAKIVKEKKLRMQYLPSTKLVSCRMYPESFRSFYYGFKKSIYGGLTILPFWRICFIILWLIYANIAPYFMVISILNFKSSVLVIIINIGAYLLFSAVMFWYWHDKGDINFFIFLFYPLFLGIDILIILISIYKGLRGEPVLWKNRSYNINISSNNGGVLKDTLQKKDK
ncbi:MAG: glycosyltransferase [Candidatus Heimdallarchaeaceae archaeon]